MNPRLFTKTREVILLKGEALTTGKKEPKQNKAPSCTHVCGRSGRNMAFQRGPSDLFQVYN